MRYSHTFCEKNPLVLLMVERLPRTGRVCLVRLQPDRKNFSIDFFFLVKV